MSDIPLTASVAPARLPLTSADPLASRYEELKALFPMAVTDGRVDLEKLRAVMGAEAATGPERYGLSWAGKSDALKVLRQLTTATLVPAPSESMNWDKTGNAIIEGDNLEVLKVLQHAYHGKVKLIYIDPPYNTGGDFIYPDDYAEGLKSYLQFTRQKDEEGRKLTTNVNTSGRYHSRWLTMIYPRLFLARNLLREDGVIFVSIDDHEVHNLRLVMDEIFGEENFIANLLWEKGRKNDAKLFSVGHEYMFVYARSLQRLRELQTVWREEKPGARDIWEKYCELRALHGGNDRLIEADLSAWYSSLPKSHPAKKWSRYKRVDKDGPWRDRDISWPGGGGPRYDVIHPRTGQPCAVPERGWIYSKPEEMARKISLGLVEFREDHTSPPFRKAHIKPVPEELDADDEEEGEDEEFATQVRSSYFYKQSQVSVKYLRTLMGEKIFGNPKDHVELARLFSYAMAEKDGLILDFFGGSGSTAESVLSLNHEDGGRRRFILVQLPEPTGRKDYQTIAEITKERVRRVIQRLEKEQAGELALADGVALDLGFKVFKLAPSNFAVWDPALAASDPAKLAEQWQLTADNVRSDVQEQALLHELMLKCGRPLAERVEALQVAGLPAFRLDEGKLVICLARALTAEAVRAIVRLGPQSVLCLDTGFKGNDALKVNAQLEFQSHGIQFRTA